MILIKTTEGKAHDPKTAGLLAPEVQMYINDKVQAGEIPSNTLVSLCLDGSVLLVTCDCERKITVIPTTPEVKGFWQLLLEVLGINHE